MRSYILLQQLFPIRFLLAFFLRFRNMEFISLSYNYQQGVYEIALYREWIKE